MLPLASFDELHVVSDLHMGGVSPNQIFDQGDRLAAWLDHVRSSAPEKYIAVCLNGDTVDFLAEPNASYFDGLTAVAKLERIASDPAFEPVWTALTRFVRAQRRTLIMTLGNHDLELALPWVRERLLTLLTRGDEAARGRIRLAFDGAGFLCRVGAAQVLCVHGNDVDTWNRTDYETLRRQGRDQLHGRDVSPWTPNAGTKLVIDVMNEMKAQYPFIDLLKPEVEAVVPMLYALQPTLKSKLKACLAVGARFAWDAVRQEVGFLGTGTDNSMAAPETSDRALESLLQATFVPPPGESSRAAGEDPLLAQTEERFRHGVEPMSLLAAEPAGARLGWAGATWNWLTGKKQSEIMREALSALKRDQSFSVKQVDDTFSRLDEWVSTDVDFLIAGHTHLQRALHRRLGNGVYYNCGTWVRLIKLSEDILASAAQFARYYRAFGAGTLEALDGEPGLVRRRRAIVSITSEDRRVRGRMRYFGEGPGADLHPVEGTEFVR